MSTFTEQLWKSAEPIYQAILEHPFNRELADGSLASNRFHYYVQQDALYLQDYTRALTLLAAKAPAVQVRHDLISYAQDGIQIEQQLHEHFMQKFNIKSVKEQQPACFNYCNFLLASTALEPFEIGLAAILPCFWIYRDVGRTIAKTAANTNPFHAWIDTYTDAEYDKVVNRMIALTDEAADQTTKAVRMKMKEAFVRSTQLEWSFWDAAYKLQKWESH